MLSSKDSKVRTHFKGSEKVELTFKGQRIQISAYLSHPVTHTNLHTLRKHAFSNILKLSAPKTENFQIKNSDIFHISAQNIDCGYTQPMFLSRNMPLYTPFLLYKSGVQGGQNYIGMFSWWYNKMTIYDALVMSINIWATWTGYFFVVGYAYCWINICILSCNALILKINNL